MANKSFQALPEEISAARHSSIGLIQITCFRAGAILGVLFQVITREWQQQGLVRLHEGTEGERAWGGLHAAVRSLGQYGWIFCSLMTCAKLPFGTPIFVSTFVWEEPQTQT